MALDEFGGRWRGPLSLGTATLGTAWASVGTQDFRTGGARNLGAFVDLTVNDSKDVRFRLRSTYASGGSAYYLPVATESASDVKVEDEYVELNVNTDQKQLIVWDLDGVAPYCTFEASAGTAGGTAGTLDGVHIVTAIE